MTESGPGERSPGPFAFVAGFIGGRPSVRLQKNPGEGSVLKNCWYVAAMSEEVGRTPLARTLLGQPVVLFRTEAGAPVALENRCIHRRMPLSAGELVGDAVQCPYHGFQFGADGMCVKAPGTPNIPRAMRVRSWPVAERHRFIWIWGGEAALADPALIPDFHQNDDAAWAHTGMLMPVAANSMLMVENLLDLSHVAFVHRNTIGTDDSDAALELERGPGFVRSVRRALDVPTPGHYLKYGLAPRCDQIKTMTFIPGSFVVLHIDTIEHAGPGSRTISIVLHNALTPETETSCHYFWTTCRNFAVQDQGVTEFFHNVTKVAFTEDLEILQLQQACISLDPSAPIVSVPGDAASVAANRLMDDLLAAERATLAAE